MYRTLDSGRIVETIEQLEHRVRERFPNAGLANVCAELAAIARASRARAEAIGRPDWRLRALFVAVMLAGPALLAWIGATILKSTRASDDMFGTLQGIDSGFNILVLMGATLFFVFTLEERLKRRRALAALHELRSIVHVIDMHQLTKDPSAATDVAHATPYSPRRTLTPFELTRYLDYCSEMLSLTAKVAVLYAQSFPDPIVTDAVSDIERVTTNLSQKIWQKIMIVRADERVASLVEPRRAAPVPSAAQTEAPAPSRADL